MDAAAFVQLQKMGLALLIHEKNPLETGKVQMAHFSAFTLQYGIGAGQTFKKEDTASAAAHKEKENAKEQQERICSIKVAGKADKKTAGPGQKGQNQPFYNNRWYVHKYLL